MAFWNRREGRKGRPVQGYYFDSEKQVGVPRKLYRHLDNEPDHVVDEWVARWSNLNEVKAIRPDLVKAQVPGDWSALVHYELWSALNQKYQEATQAA